VLFLAIVSVILFSAANIAHASCVVTTAVFSTCGMGIVVFTIAAILSMPKQFITVYLGVILEQSADGQTDKESRIISDVVLAVTMLITVAAMWYIFRQMNKVKPEVIYARRKARQNKLTKIGNLSPSEVASSSEIPLTAPAANNVFAPEPIRMTNAYGYSKDVERGSEESLSSAEDDLRTPRRGNYAPARQSTDEVGWDLGQQGHQRYGAARSPPPGISIPERQFTTSPPSTNSAYGQPGMHIPPTGQPGGQFATQHRPYLPSPYEQESIPREAARSPPLPLPNFPPPHAPPTQSQHVIEPTGMSYHTAMGSEYSDTGAYAAPGTSPPKYSQR
jgi:hypothetical protein